MNSRILRHILFWIFYFFENSLFQYTYIQSFLPNTKHTDLVAQALVMNLALLPSKLLFTYCVFGFSLPLAFKKSISNFNNVVITMIFLLFAILLHRFCTVYVAIRSPHFFMKATYMDMFDAAQFFTALLDVGFVCGVAIALKLFRMQLRTLNKEKDLIKEKLETELKFLKGQLNPHFLFNTLNNIYALTRKRSELAPIIILKLSKLLRFMLYESEKNYVPISDEIRVLEDYIEVEKVRFSRKLSVTFIQNVDNNNQPITPLILLPFIENAFKHGPGEMLSNSFIDIDIRLVDGNLTFIVINSKEHTEYELTTKKIGLGNVRRQLELMYQEFKLQTESLSETFKIELTINLKKNAAI